MFMGSYLFVILVPSGICYFRYFAYEPILKIMFIVENDPRGLGSMHPRFETMPHHRVDA